MITFKKQAGGTLLGLMIGLIIGLGIAVAVAISIKNTPFPFANKLGKTEKPVMPAPNHQINDPNRPLYGNKDAVKEAAKEFAKKTEEQKPAEVQEVKTSEVAKPDPKVAKAAEKPLPLIDKVANPDDKFIYFLQAGAFLERADAENTKAKLALIGFPANVGERQSENGTLYRVRIGPFGQLDAMNRARTKLSDNGVDVAVIRVPK
jgi:cell division protein FtsN